jgi:glycosyltransferase involved in cell wall biosynthesis
MLMKSDKPKILFVAFQGDRQSNGGIESATQIFEALSREFDWTLLTNAMNGRTLRWTKLGARVELFKYQEDDRRWRRVWSLVKLLKRTLYLSLHLRPEIIHANDIRAARVALICSSLLSIPLVFTIRATKTAGEAYGRHWRQVCRRASKVVVLSGEMARAVAANLGVAVSCIEVIYSIVDADRFRPSGEVDRRNLRADLGIRGDEVAVGIVGGVTPQKGQLEFLRNSMPRLSRECENLRLHILGDFRPDRESYAKSCASVVALAGLSDRVIFHGFSSNIDLWLKSLDIVLVTSHFEGLARCMIEGMSCGAPVVSFDVCSALETLDVTGAGVVVARGDYDSLSEAIVELYRDAKMRSNMGIAGSAVSRGRFNREIVAAQWRALYVEVFTKAQVKSI